MSEAFKDYQEYNAIIAPNWLGDIIMTEPLIRALKGRYPESGIILLGNDIAKSLLPFFPQVDHFISTQDVRNGLSLRKRRNIAKALNKFNTKRAYIVPNSFKSALIPYIARIPERIGYVGEMRFPLLTSWRKSDDIQLELSRFTALSNLSDIDDVPYSFPRLQINPKEKDNIYNRYPIKNLPTLVIAPGAEFGPSKKWEQNGFDHVIQWANNNAIQVILLGTKKDSDGLHLDDSATINLMGKTSIEDAIYICAIAKSVLCHDSGLMHVASAVSTPVVALYGPTSSERTPPLNEKARIIQSNDVPCRPCYKKECPLGHHDCMKNIKTEEVINAIKTYF